MVAHRPATPAEIDRMRELRAAAGSAPLPAFHPIAMAELRRAREVAL